MKTPAAHNTYIHTYPHIPAENYSVVVFFSCQGDCDPQKNSPRVRVRLRRVPRVGSTAPLFFNHRHGRNQSCCMRPKTAPLDSQRQPGSGVTRGLIYSTPPTEYPSARNIRCSTYATAWMRYYDSCLLGACGTEPALCIVYHVLTQQINALRADVCDTAAPSNVKLPPLPHGQRLACFLEQPRQDAADPRLHLLGKGEKKKQRIYCKRNRKMYVHEVCILQCRPCCRVNVLQPKKYFPRKSSCVAAGDRAVSSGRRVPQIRDPDAQHYLRFCKI